MPLCCSKEISRLNIYGQEIQKNFCSRRRFEELMGMHVGYQIMGHE